MTLRINTNIAAMTAHKNMIKTDNGLTGSLERLSSGLRINKAADDASGMAIADSLRSQGLALGQAIKNANDGISMVQTADGALEESINIVNTIKTKAIQAAQDGQTTESRKAIQSDINRLMEELDIIAKTTSFNNQKLLSGSFTNKKFQVGAYSGETVNISIATAESTKIGHVSTIEWEAADESVASGTVDLSIFSNIQNESYTLGSIDIAYGTTASAGLGMAGGSREESLGAIADAINKLSDTLGITADADVSVTAASGVAGGTLSSGFAINGITIGAVEVEANDSNGALVAAINQKTDQHGVLASVDQSGKLTLTSTDDRAINVGEGTGDAAVLASGGSDDDFDTYGKIVLTQEGAAGINLSDGNGILASGADSDASYTLSDVSVTSQEDAQIAISVASSALKSLDKVRSDLGSVQNQLTSTIANITVTRVNIFASESAIRDVDFANEASNYTKLQIMAQAGSFAMAQANATAQNVLSLLQ